MFNPVAAADPKLYVGVYMGQIVHYLLVLVLLPEILIPRGSFQLYN
jgi:hypothetical protein